MKNVSPSYSHAISSLYQIANNSLSVHISRGPPSADSRIKQIKSESTSLIPRKSENTDIGSTQGVNHVVILVDSKIKVSPDSSAALKQNYIGPLKP